MARAAFYGLAGEVVTTLEKHTEADPVALLLQYLTSFGNALGRGPYYAVEADRHFGNLFVLLIGDTAKARKGTSAERIHSIFTIANPTWAGERTRGGMSSGEGIIHAIRDPVWGLRNGTPVLTDPGIVDKRLLLTEHEFFGVLTVLKREGNTLSRVVRDAWDCRKRLETLTKHSPTSATEACVSIIAHITIDELRQLLDHTSMANGFANRFLFACIRRGALLPFGGALAPEILQDLGEQTGAALQAAEAAGSCVVGMDAGARFLWTSVYTELSRGGTGLIDYVTARAEAQSVRLALLYALLDQATEIRQPHLEAGLAVWHYCAASARFIFGDLLGEPIADTILRMLRQVAPAGLNRTDISALFGRHVAAGHLDRALAALLIAGKARCDRQPSGSGLGGRPREMWYAA
jgi:hypothetical protein